MLILLKLKFETLLFLSISNKSFIYCTVQTTDWCFVWFAITCSRPLQYTITWWFYPNLDLYLYQGSISFEKLIFNRNQNHLIHLFEIDILTRIRSIDHSVDYSWPFYWLSLINYFKPNFILWCRTMMSSDFNNKQTFTVDYLDHIPNWLDLLYKAEAEFKISFLWIGIYFCIFSCLKMQS